MRAGSAARAAPHTLAGAYALDALGRHDRARFRRHVARCKECARELDDLREAAAKLAAAVSTRPGAAMKHRVLAVAARTRQLAPAMKQPPAGWRARPSRGGLAGLAGRQLAARRPAGRQPAGRQPAARRPAGRQLAAWRPAGRQLAALYGRAWLPRLVTALAAVALVVSATFWLARSGASSSQRPGDSRPVAAVLNAPDAAMFHARITTGGTATVVMSHRERRLVFTAAGLRALPGSKCYELWLMGRRGDRPAALAGPGHAHWTGVLPMPKHGMTGPVAASGLRPGDRLGLSVEPASGSASPTSAMIMVVNL
jgi:hypothetical protein